MNKLKPTFNHGILKKIRAEYKKTSRLRALHDKHQYEAFLARGELKKLDEALRVRHENEEGIERENPRQRNK